MHEPRLAAWPINSLTGINHNHALIIRDRPFLVQSDHQLLFHGSWRPSCAASGGFCSLTANTSLVNFHPGVCLSLALEHALDPWTWSGCHYTSAGQTHLQTHYCRAIRPALSFLGPLLKPCYASAPLYRLCGLAPNSQGLTPSLSQEKEISITRVHLMNTTLCLQLCVLSS